MLNNYSVEATIKGLNSIYSSYFEMDKQTQILCLSKIQ